jgi:cation diffusion facilitator family transporter
MLPRLTKLVALRISLIAIISVILVEGAAAYLTGSLALASDAAHALFDGISTLILFVATRLSLKPADEDHTYGHGKIETLGALIGGITLLVLAGSILILALSRFTGGHIVQASLFGFIAAAYTMAIDVFRMLILTIALKTGSLSVKADLYHAVSDFVSTGLVFVALFLTRIGYPVGDTVVSLILASLLGYLSLRLVYVSSLDLSDAISGKLVHSIMHEIKRTDEVLKVKELRARRVGEVTFVDAVIAVSPYAQVVDADSIASRVEMNLSKLLGQSSVMIHIEPVEWEVPIELRIRNATRGVEGASGIHNLTVTDVQGVLHVTLHVQVAPTLALDRAHQIAESVERSIEASVPNVRDVTVHLEPAVAESTRGTVVDDESIADTVRSVIESYGKTVKLSAIFLYSSKEGLHINIRCSFKADHNIARVHELASKIENSVRKEFRNAIVTIQAEPYA